ncbi:helix-turn-helix transcriptional regulator [Sphingomonas sp. CFBP 8760]|nr:helix-turn-helix transcriptional regulator [Sphingomonas sp. CFBP 8760]
MEMDDAIPVLSALAQPTRYRCVSHLVDRGECTAGELAQVLGVPANTMSSHLTILAHAGLVASQRHGRNIVYAACVEKIADVAGMLSALVPDPAGR